MVVALSVLAMGEEALRDHQMEIVLGARHCDIEEAPLLLDLFRSASAEVRWNASIDDIEHEDRLPFLCRVSDTGPLMIYPPVLMAGIRKPSGKEPAGGGVGGLLSMGICRGSVLGRGCTGRRNGRRTDDRGRDFVAAPAVGGVFLA